MAISPWSGRAADLFLNRRQGHAQGVDGHVASGAVSEGCAVGHALAFQPDAEAQVFAAHVQWLAGLQLLGHLAGGFAVGEVARQQQLLTIGRQQTKAETAVVFAEADETRGFRGFLLGGRRDLGLGHERTQANRFAQLVEERRRYRTSLFCADLQDVFQVCRALDQLVIALAGLPSSLSSNWNRRFFASPQPRPCNSSLRNSSDCAGVAKAWNRVNRCELSGSLASPGARESVTIREIASFISLALLNNGMVLS